MTRFAAAASLVVALVAVLLPAPVAAEGLIRRLLAKNPEEAHNAVPVETRGHLLAQDPTHGQETWLESLRKQDERRGRRLKKTKGPSSSSKTKSPKDKTKGPSSSSKTKSPKDKTKSPKEPKSSSSSSGRRLQTPKSSSSKSKTTKSSSSKTKTTKSSISKTKSSSSSSLL